jgi:hypothetical protein
MLRDGVASEALPPKNVALALVAKDNCNKATFEAIYDCFKTKYPKSDKLGPVEFSDVMSSTREAHHQTDEQVGMHNNNNADTTAHATHFCITAASIEYFYIIPSSRI